MVRFSMKVFLIVTVVFMAMFMAVFEWSQATLIANHELAHYQNCLYQGGDPEFVVNELGRETEYFVVCDLEVNHKYDFDSINEAVGYQIFPVLRSIGMYGFIILMYMATIAGIILHNQKG